MGRGSANHGNVAKRHRNRVLARTALAYPAARLLLAGTFILALTGTALADGGKGGDGAAHHSGTLGEGGAGGTLEHPAAQDGGDVTDGGLGGAAGGGGGGGGPGGGSGGSGSKGNAGTNGGAGDGGDGGDGGTHGFVGSSVPPDDASGGAGTNGQAGGDNAYFAGGGGGGGAGGYGAMVAGGGTGEIDADQTLSGGVGGVGGVGGNGGEVAGHGGDGGSGGSGGIGLFFSGQTLANSATIAGGIGGNGGAGGLGGAGFTPSEGGVGGDGGDGGSGVSFSGQTLSNNATIAGGDGGRGGHGGGNHNPGIGGLGGDGGDGGDGGFGLSFSGKVLTNNATIAGGDGGDGGYGGGGWGGWSDGGDAGAGGIGLSFSGEVLTNNATITGGDGGDGGYVGRGSGDGSGKGGKGGDGGIGLSAVSADILINGSVQGGNGGLGETGRGPGVDSSEGSSGGDGGVGLSAVSDDILINGSVQGGNGGLGGKGWGDGDGGSGGDGGVGLSASNADIMINGSIRGGHGGLGGDAMLFSNTSGSGGDGGIGISTSSADILIKENGSIQGGNGGLGGDAEYSEKFGSVGRGGVGLLGDNLNVVTAGTITGGLSGDGVTRANAISFTGGSNTLELRHGFDFVGNVVVKSGATGTVILGGDDNASFDLSTLTASPSTDDGWFVGFDAFEKTGTSVWTLAGETTEVMPWTLREGKLSISSDANLGHQDGGLTFAGGALVTIADMDSARSVTLAGTGAFEVASATTFGLIGAIGGSGDVLKQGHGTLVLTGMNTYEGDTLVEAGTLVGNAASIRGNIGNGATLVFDQADDAAFAGDIGGLGGTNGQMVKQGMGTLTLDGVSTLDWTISEGGLETQAAQFGGNVQLDGAGTVLSFTDSDNAAYDGIISGNGQFSIDGKGAVLLTGDSAGFAGTTALNAGTLLIGGAHGNGVLGGSLDVLDGATLGGSGTIGSGAGSSVTVATGGTLSPGNSTGTLTVDGDLVFATGSRLAVEVDPEGSESDRVAVTGTATLNGGAAAHIGANGNYDLRSTYTILSAGELDGAFEDVTSDFAFLTPDLIYDYDTGTVDLELVRNDIHFASTAQTRNQIATAEGIESIGIDAGHAVYDAIAQLADDDLIPASFDALSGEIHGSAKTALIEDSRFLRDAVNDRIRAAFSNVPAAAMPVMAYGPDGPRPAAAGSIGLVAWSQVYGAWGEMDGNGNAASLDRSTGGFLTGIDGAITTNIRLGFVAGYGHSSFHANERASSGSSDNYHLGLYGGGQWDALRLSGGLAYTWHDIETNRSVAFPGFADRPSASYDAGTFQAFGEAGYRIDTAVATFEPFIGLAHVSLRTDGFAEDGGAAALSAKGQTTDTTFTTLGLHAATDFDLAGMRATAHSTLGWRHAFGDTVPIATQAFAGGEAFTVAGTPIAEDAAIIEAGLDLGISDNATLGVSYSGQIASDAQEHGFNAKLSVRF